MKNGEGGLFTLEADVVPVYDDLPEPGVDLQRLGQQPRPAVPHPVTADVQHLLTHPSLERGQRSFAKFFTIKLSGGERECCTVPQRILYTGCLPAICKSEIEK